MRTILKEVFKLLFSKAESPEIVHVYDYQGQKINNLFVMRGVSKEEFTNRLDKYFIAFKDLDDLIGLWDPFYKNYILIGFSLRSVVNSTYAPLYLLLADKSTEEVREMARKIDPLIFGDMFRYKVRTHTLADFIRHLLTMDIVDILLPEFADNIDCCQDPRYHTDDVALHLLKCLQVSKDFTINPLLSLAAFCHDIGKAKTRAEIEVTSSIELQNQE